MEIPKSVSMIFLVICSLAFVGYSQVTGSVGDKRACIQKLMPCRAYLKGTPPPPIACCGAMKQLVPGDTKCLCAIYNNKAMLKTLNATLLDAFYLIRNCGADDNYMLLCPREGAAAPASKPTAPSTHGSETKKNTATAISQARIWVAIISFIVLIF